MKALKYIIDWYRLPSRRQKLPARPRELNFPVTDNCNARCVMCNVWKENVTDDLQIQQIRSLVRQPFFRDLEHVGLSGGEPLLRRDLLEIIAAFLELPRIKSISITSHGFNVRRHEQLLAPAMQLCADRGVSFVLNLSLDGVGVVHDRVRGIPGGFERVKETLQLARSLNIPVRAQCTVSTVNVYNLPALRAFAEAEALDITYRAATRIERLGNQESIEEVALSFNEKSFFADFLESDAVNRATQNPARRLFYKSLVKMLVDGADRTAPCYYQNEGVLLSSRGEVFHCSISNTSIANVAEDDLEQVYFSKEAEQKRVELLENTCRTCVHDQAGAWAPAKLIGEQLAGRGLLAQLRRKSAEALEVLPGLLTPSPRFRAAEESRPPQLASCVVIGCYGGEHVGDAAILGGVLKRLVERHGTSRFIICSSRPHRTKRWATEIDLPVSIEVVDYSINALAREMREADYLVIGGGPLMDIPLLLLRHLRSFRIAKRLGKPVFMEGIGYGPFRRSLSRRIAQTLIAAADRVSVRTQAALQEAGGTRRDLHLSSDPAFDYLEGIAEASLTIPASAPKARDGKSLVAVNMRPLWSRYATPEYTDSDVSLVETQAMEAIVQWIRLRQDLDFVFLPMNADQFGMSDLEIASRLSSMLGPSAPNFQVWEAEPGIEEVCAFLKQCGALVAMRFHACIFGLAMGIPVLGIDYGIGKDSKVAELLQERDTPYLPVNGLTLNALEEAFSLMVAE